MGTDATAETFDVSKLHDTTDLNEPRKYGEQEYFRKYMQLSEEVLYSQKLAFFQIVKAIHIMYVAKD